MESTQERILAAARQLFGQSGFRGTTTAEIARTAGIAEGTIFRYYKDKKELLIACTEPAIQEIIRRQRAIIRDGTPRERLRRRMIEWVQVVREHIGVFNILFTEGKHHPEIAQILMQEVAQSITPEEWQGLELLRAVDPAAPEPNPLIMTVGLMASIWAMVGLEPMAEKLFEGWPVRVQPSRLESDFADFVCSALLGREQPEWS
ncbi:MAG TPA: TetR/AcrR family transcriptional regulator [Symbiobacteriaceae bacterium]|nr:TetR/AcrR family transcriptional regulator [Symbiobacteriaceae bacterium]